MGKYECMSISEFMGRKSEPVPSKLEQHFKKYGFVYKVIGTTVIILAAGDFSFAFADTGIDKEARKLYYEIVDIGKWIIVFKGGIDIVKSVTNGDFDAAKKGFFSYLLIYLLLLGLPYGLDKVDQVFERIT